MSEGKIKLLVIDDHPFFGMDLKYKLQPYNVEVDTSPDGERGIDHILFSKPDLVFVDYMMPVMDGLETIRNIRKIKSLEKLPLILFTSEAYPNVIKEAVKAGASDFITKTTPFEILLQKIQHYKAQMEK